MSSQSRHFSSHRLRIGRRSLVGQAYVVTTVTRDRNPIFSDWGRACACARVLHRMPAHAPVNSFAWVVMPDHIHWLFGLEAGTLGGAMKTLKAHAAHAINGISGVRGSIWQPGYHDHALRREEDIRVFARYIVANPVRAGLCNRVGDYPFWDAIWVEGGNATDFVDDIVSMD